MATNAVLKYLQDTNRPYSANDVMVNLHNEYSKAVVQKSLDQLTEAGFIKEKTYGKQKVYSIMQPEEDDQQNWYKELEEKVLKSSENLESVEKQLKTTNAEIQEIRAVLTTEQAIGREKELKRSLKILDTKHKELSQSVRTVLPEERDKLKKEVLQYVKEYKKRKRLCMDLVDGVLEGYQVPKQSLLEEIGIETDEDANMAPLN